MPKGLFWNLGGAKKSRELIESILVAESPDVAAFAEVAIAQLPNVSGYQNKPVKARLKLYVRNSLGGQFTISLDGHPDGYVITRWQDDAQNTHHVVFAHLMSSVDNGTAIRRIEMRVIGENLKSIDPFERVVVVGDLNTDPFANDLLHFEGLHAVQTFHLARQALSHRDRGSPRMVALGHGHLGRRNSSAGIEFAGSYLYRNAKYDQLPYRLYDQALVSQDLELAHMRVVDQIDTIDLVTFLGTVEKDREWPDHLPIVVEW